MQNNVTVQCMRDAYSYWEELKTVTMNTTWLIANYKPIFSLMWTIRFEWNSCISFWQSEDNIIKLLCAYFNCTFKERIVQCHHHTQTFYQSYSYFQSLLHLFLLFPIYFVFISQLTISQFSVSPEYYKTYWNLRCST